MGGKRMRPEPIPSTVRKGMEVELRLPMNRVVVYRKMACGTSCDWWQMVRSCIVSNDGHKLWKRHTGKRQKPVFGYTPRIFRDKRPQLWNRIEGIGQELQG